jgi:AcrR family transcriptional regulator
VLIFLDHAFEMLFKAIILHRGGRIREARAAQTIGFDASVRKGLSDAKVKFLTDHQALMVQMINSLRGHILDISEGHLYIQAHAGLSLFRTLFEAIFQEELQAHLPPRVLPLSTAPPTDLATLFDGETREIKKLLAPGHRRRTEADARLRSLAIVDYSLRGKKTQPSTGELRRIGSELSVGAVERERELVTPVGRQR